MEFLLPACRICHFPALPSSVECSLLFFAPLSTVPITVTLRLFCCHLGWCSLDSPLALQLFLPAQSFASSILSLEPSDPFLQPWEKLFLPCWTHPCLRKGWEGGTAFLSLFCVSQTHCESLGQCQEQVWLGQGWLTSPCEGRRTWLGGEGAGGRELCWTGL